MTAVAFTCLICGLPHGFETPAVLLAAHMAGIDKDPHWAVCEPCTPLLNLRQINWNAVSASRVSKDTTS